MPLPYVLITPARNEADFIEKTIQSVIAQTVLPLRWVIVSDGSTDDTDADRREVHARPPLARTGEAASTQRSATSLPRCTPSAPGTIG